MVSSERFRPGDADRDAVTEMLREHHLAGRLDGAEFEARVARCLAARTYGELNAIMADLPHSPGARWVRRAGPGRSVAAPGRHGTMQGMHVRRGLRGLAVLIAILTFVIWLLTAPAAFWPAWVWQGLAIPFALDAAIRWAWRSPAGAVRRAVVVGTVFAVIESTLIVIWALESLDAGGLAYFWPAWPLVGMATAIGVYYVAVVRPRLDPAGRAALAAQVETLSRSRRQTVDHQAAELGRIERDLHDGAQARLVALSLQLGRAELALEDQPGARHLVEEARQEASRAIADLRDLSRGISPPLLSDRGLVAAVRGLAVRHDADVQAAPGLEHRRLAPALERGAYFVVAEALTNAAKHASAERVSVRLERSGPELVVAVADDGHGGADPGGSGLSGLRERVEALGGSLRLASSNEGTTVEARFPIGS